MDSDKIHSLLEIMNSATAAKEASNPREAADLYVDAISVLEGGLVDLHVARASSWMAAGEFDKAQTAAQTAIQRNPTTAAAWYWKGSALLANEKPEEAKRALKKAVNFEKDSKVKASYKEELSRCEDLLAQQSPVSEPVKSPAPKPTAPASSAAKAVPAASKSEKPVSEASRDVPMSDASEATAQPAAPPQPQGDPRMQWYQSVSHVNVDIYAKNVVQNESSIEFTDSAVKMCLRRPGCDDYSLEIALADGIVPAGSSWSMSRFKVELRLKKTQGATWKSLDAEGKMVSAAIEASMLSRKREDRHSERQKGLAQMAEEELKDYNEDDSAMSMFRMLYKDADEDTRRAMMKSYSESGGQVLSTNWEEVAKKKVVYEGKD